MAGRATETELMRGELPAEKLCPSYCGERRRHFGYGAKVALNNEFCRLGLQVIRPTGELKGTSEHVRARRDVQNFDAGSLESYDTEVTGVEGTRVGSGGSEVETWCRVRPMMVAGKGASHGTKLAVTL